MALRRLVPLLVLLAGTPAFAGVADYPGAMSLAVERWIGSQKPSGFLRYGFDFLADEESEKDTVSAANLTRQAGTAATLADYYALTGDERARAPLVRLLDAMRARSLPIGKSSLQTLVERTRLLSLPVGRYRLHRALQHFGLVYRPVGPGRVLSPTHDYGQAYTGATALALLAELRFARAGGDDRFADVRGQWLDALIGLRIPGLGFRQIADSIDHDAYFDGQAWLAMAEYRRAFPDDTRAATALSATDDDLLDFYGRSFRLAFFHWGTMAAAARYRDTKDPKFLDFVRMQMRGFLDAKGTREDGTNNCALAEGVADGLAALAAAGERESALAAQARAWLSREMAKAEKLQIRPGQEGLEYPNASVSAPRMREFSGSFLEGVHVPRTQVDLTAHCVSAMVKIRRSALLPSAD